MLVLACAAFMFVDRHVPPLILWDESRLAVNALEMHQRGWSLVTTYGFEPDHWNTKPPLMIWLMNASVSVFGPSELALRFPAMLAALATIAIVFVFTRRVSHSTWTAVLAALLLAGSVGFYGEHGARTADYDALLCFFTTAYLTVFYFAVHRRRPGMRHLLLAGVLVAGATMTKTTAGLVPGVGVALYLAVSGRLHRAYTTPRYFMLLLLALLPLVAFYLARERLAPGYLEAVWHNDFSGRFRDKLVRQGGPPWYYVQLLFRDGLFSAGPLALLAPLGLAGAKGQTRQGLVFALCCFFGQLAVVSITATRLIQYILPALPWLAIACALTVKARLPRFLGYSALQRPSWSKLILPLALVTVAIVNIGVRTAVMRYDLLLGRAYYPQAGYGALFTSLRERGVGRLAVLEPGFAGGGVTNYQPQFDYYALLWRTRGMTISRIEKLPLQRSPMVTASCNPDLGGALRARGAYTVGSFGCVATNLPVSLARSTE